MFPDPPLDDVRDVLQGRREVLQPIMAESGVVGEVRVVPMLDIAISLCYLHRDNSIEQLSSVAPDHLLGRAKLRQRLAVPEKFSVDHQFCFFFPLSNLSFDFIYQCTQIIQSVPKISRQ